MPYIKNISDKEVGVYGYRKDKYQKVMLQPGELIETNQSDHKSYLINYYNILKDVGKPKPRYLHDRTIRVACVILGFLLGLAKDIRLTPVIK